MELPRLSKSSTFDGIHFHRSGQGPALLLIHGVGMGADSWYQQVAQLSSDFTVYALDLPGHGESRELEVEYLDVSLAHFVAAVEDFIDTEIKTELVICGHSLGALIAADIASKRTKTVSGLLLLNPVFRRSKVERQAVRIRANKLAKSNSVIGVEQTLDRWFGVPPKKAMHRHVWMCYKWLTQNSVPGYAAAYKAFADVSGASKKTLKDIDASAIFMTGDQDPNSTPEMSQSMAEVRQRHKSVIVPGAGHMLPLTHVDEVCNQLLFMT